MRVRLDRETSKKQSSAHSLTSQATSVAQAILDTNPIASAMKRPGFGEIDFPLHEKALSCQPKFLVLGFDCVPSFHSGEVVSRRARVQSQVERSEPEGNLDGFLARLHDFPQKRRPGTPSR